MTSSAVSGSLQPVSPRGAATTKAATPAPYRWTILLVAWASFCLTFIDRLAWGNVAIHVGETLGLPIAAFGSFFAAFYSGYFITNIAGGFAADRFGGRVVLVVSLLMLGASTALFGTITGVFEGLMLQALMGLVAGADYVACIKLIARWFPREERGTAMGLLLSAPAIGVAVPNLIIPTMLQWVDWRGAYYSLGAATALVGLWAIVAVSDAPPGAVLPAAPPRLRLLQLAANRNWLLITLCGFGLSWAMWGFAFWSNVLLVHDHHLAPKWTGLMVGLYGATGIVTKPAVGWIQDRLRLSCRWLSIVGLILSIILLIVFSQTEDPQLSLILSILVGVTLFGTTVPSSTILMGTVTPAHVASAVGISNAFWQLANVLNPIVVGATFRFANDFATAYYVMVAGPIIGLVCLFLIRERAGGDYAPPESATGR
jgi:sugar phosphate permease